MVRMKGEILEKLEAAQEVGRLTLCLTHALQCVVKQSV
jgi:hypothetical protein